MDIKMESSLPVYLAFLKREAAVHELSHAHFENCSIYIQTAYETTKKVSSKSVWLSVSRKKYSQKTSYSLNPDAEVQLQQAPNETRGFEPIHQLAQWW